MNYCDDLLRHCNQDDHKRLFVELETGREVTFGEVKQRMLAMASYLTSVGVGPNTSVAIHLHNSIDAIVIHLATQYLGARSCFIDALVQPKSLAYYVHATHCILLATHATELPIEVLAQSSLHVLHVSDILELSQHPAETCPQNPYQWKVDEVCYVYFTSGTTSEPKGVQLTSRNHENFTRICDAYWKPVDTDSKHLCFVPFSHGFGTVFLVPLAMRTKSELYLLRAFHPLRVVEAIAAQGITHLYGVPSHYQQLLRFPDVKRNLATLKMAFCAAAKLEHRLMIQWEETTATVLCEGYGLIETCCGTVWRVGAPSLGTGHMGPCPDPSLVQIGIYDEMDEPLQPGQIGQIAVRGPSVMHGYLNQDEETKRVIRRGWFFTGDEGYVTPEGELFMTGRIKDIINIAGIKVSPYEVEAVLLKHPAVAESAVVATPDTLYGEVVKAYVRRKPGVTVTERELVRFAAEHLINFQVPKRIEFVESFPLNNMGKLDRKQLRAQNAI